MISMETAFSWLNRVDNSHISAANLLSLIQLQDLLLPPDFRKNVLRNLQNYCEFSPDLLETLEIRMSIGAILYKQEEYGLAKTEIVNAYERYLPGSHRQAVARWMLAILLWKVKDYQAAYAFAFDSVATFQNLGRAALSANDVPLSVWYTQHIKEMRLDMVATAEEAFFWLNYFEPSRLFQATQAYVQELRNKIINKEFPLAYEIGRGLIRVAMNRDPVETAEAWVIFGLAAYQMGNPRQAVDYYQRGASAFIPWGHQQASTRWMMGVAYWQIPSEREMAVRMWTNAIEAFRGLSRIARNENNNEKTEWYLLMIDLMSEVLSLKMSST